MHQLTIVDVAQHAGFTLEEIRELTGSPPDGHPAGGRLRELAERKLPDMGALIERAQAVERWLNLAATYDCPTVDVCGLFVDPTLAPPPREGPLDVHDVPGRHSGA